MHTPWLGNQRIAVIPTVVNDSTFDPPSNDFQDIVGNRFYFDPDPVSGVDRSLRSHMDFEVAPERPDAWNSPRRRLGQRYSGIGSTLRADDINQPRGRRFGRGPMIGAANRWPSWRLIRSPREAPRSRTTRAEPFDAA